MPFIDTRDRIEKSNIADNLKPISVMMSHAADGRFIPLMFQVISEDESRQQFRIDAVKQIKEKHDRVIFYCLITNYSRQQEVALTYYIQDPKWYIEV